MNKAAINKITKSIYQQFPEMKGSKPTIEPNKQYQAKSPSLAQTYQLTFSKMATDALGNQFPRRVRVVSNDKGEILRVSTSR